MGRDVNTYFPGLRIWEFSGFVSDRWQFSPKLTLSLGLRWELFPAATEPYAAGFSNYNQVNNTLVVGGVGAFRRW